MLRKRKGKGMNIDNYRVFIRVAKIGNLTAAAEQLGYTQSGISHIVSALEQEFGFQLLRRSKTGVSLTQEGERILQTLRELVDGEDRRHPLSDERLMTLLHQHGYDVARRTIAKYRTQLGIPESRLRKP